MIKILLAGTSAVGIALAVQQAHAQTLAQVGGVDISLQQVEAVNPAIKQNDQVLQETLSALVNRQALVNAAHQEGLQNTKAYKNALKQAGDNIAIDLLVQKYFEEHPVPEADVKAAYDQLIKHPMPKEFRLREILLPDEASAQSVISELKSGKSFSTLAEEKSIDKLTAQLGGEVGWQSEATLRPTVLSALKDLKEGGLTNPITVPDGYAVIQLMGTRTAPTPTYDQIKGEIIHRIRQQQLNQYIAELRTAQHANLTANGKK